MHASLYLPPKDSNIGILIVPDFPVASPSNRRIMQPGWQNIRISMKLRNADPKMYRTRELRPLGHSGLHGLARQCFTRTNPVSLMGFDIEWLWPLRGNYRIRLPWRVILSPNDEVEVAVAAGLDSAGRAIPLDPVSAIQNYAPWRETAGIYYPAVDEPKTAGAWREDVS